MPGDGRCNTELIDVEPRFTGLLAVKALAISFRSS